VKRTNKQVEEELGELSTGDKVIFSVWGTILFGGVLLIGRTIIRTKRANKEQDKSYKEGTSDNYAKQIQMALHNDGWWGADTVALRNVLIQIPSQEEYQKVIQSYDTQNKGASMLTDMGKELKTTELDEMNSIINAKPKKTGDKADLSVVNGEWANRIKSALDKTWGIFHDSDTDAVKAVFYEIPTQGAYLGVSNTYAAQFHKSLDDDLRSGLGSDYSTVMDIINKKPIA
jgi:hypothetical protein